VLLLTSDKSRLILLSDVDNSREDRTITVAKLDLLQGTLDLLILKTLALGPQHGWGIAQRIQQISGQVLKVNQGSLYPALQRLETAGWIDAEWGASENNRQARFYSLTRNGERQLKDETLQWERMIGAVAKILASDA
jgi:PadR family transcriptional regulator, regulatory protein PadR